MKLPAPRGPLGASLTDLLVHPPRDTDAVDDEVLTRWRDAATTADPLTDDDVQLTLWTLYALHYRGFEGVDDAWEWDPDLLRLRRGPRGRVRGGAPRPGAGSDGDGCRARGRRGCALRDDGTGTGTERRPLRQQVGRRDAGRGVPRPPVALHAHGGRPAHVGGPAADRGAQGGAGRGAGRRVRRRSARTHAQRAVRPHDARRRARRRVRVLRRPAAGRHDRRAQPHVAVRAAPSVARGDRRAPRGVRDDVVAAEPPLRGRVPAARSRRGHHRLLRRARRGRRRARADRRPGPGGTARGAGARAGRRHPLRCRRLPVPRRARRPAPARRVVGRHVLAACAA